MEFNIKHWPINHLPFPHIFSATAVFFFSFNSEAAQRQTQLKQGHVYFLSGFLQYNYGHFDKLLAKLTYMHICKYQYPYFNGLVGGSSLF